MTNTKKITAGGAIFARLKALGIDYVFANSGTDFPPIIEGLAEAKAKDIDLPDALVITLNNEEWGAVRASVSGVYPKGYATKSNDMPLTSLKPSPDFTMTAKASRAWTKEVISAEEVPGAINEAIKIVQTEKRCALLNIKILPD
ncbi:MAG: thiamine pyrophosphate-dependent enzyme [Rhizobiaceae bacterium]